MLTTNAGHNPPLLKHADGSVTALSQRDGLVVAAMEGIAYSEQCMQLQQGDTLLLYTDGVTEADNINEEFFGDDRLKRLLTDWQGGPVENLVDHIIATTHAFEGENRQADDITVLALHYTGQQVDDAPGFTITIGNKLTDIELVIEKFVEFSSANNISGTISNPVCMAFDELLTNIISYGYVDKARHEISIKVSFTREEPDTELAIEERGVGGLGIHLVKNVMDEAHYKRHIDKNVITLVKHIEQEK